MMLRVIRAWLFGPILLLGTIFLWVLIFKAEDPAWWLWSLAILCSLVLLTRALGPLIPARSADMAAPPGAGADPEILAAIASLAAAGAVVLKELIKQVFMTVRTSMRENTIRRAQGGQDLTQRQVEEGDTSQDEDSVP
jgi:hypothetical protein